MPRRNEVLLPCPHFIINSVFYFSKYKNNIIRSRRRRREIVQSNTQSEISVRQLRDIYNHIKTQPCNKFTLKEMGLNFGISQPTL